jgi:transcriptional regulator with XRE-family HTH domain
MLGIIQSRILVQSSFKVAPMATLADRVREAIETSDVSVSSIAEACGISQQSVYQWINGETKELMGDHLVELAELTGHEARWIAKGSGPKKRIYARTEQQAHVLNAMQAMDSYEAALLVKITDTIPPKSMRKEEKNGNSPAV